MKKSKKGTLPSITNTKAVSSEPESINDQSSARKRFWTNWNGRVAAIVVCLLLVISAVGGTLKYLKDSAREQKSQAKNFSNNQQPNLLNSINPFIEPPLPTSTPQLDKQNIYAGGRLIAVETAGTTTATSGQQISDLVVWRPSAGGAWYIKDSTDGTTQTALWGGAGDVPLPADFDGDNLADFCVVRPNSPSTGAFTWFIQPNGSTIYYGLQFGVTSDKPVPADFDGDGKADITVWRYTDKTFYAVLSSTNTLSSFTMQQFTTGQSTDIPVPADFDGDGMADAAVFRPGSPCYWYIRRSMDNLEQVTAYGTTGDLPVKGDYDGDGRIDLAVRRDSTNEWIAQYSSNSQNVTQTIPTATITLQASDQSVQGDYDGDGKTDAAVWRPSNGTWYIRKSTDSQMRVEAWGQSGDVPVPAPLKR